VPRQGSLKRLRFIVPSFVRGRIGETFLALFDGRRPRSRSIAINGTRMVSMVHEMARPPFFVELASDDGRLESLGERNTRGLLRFLEEDIDPLRSLNANQRVASDIGHSIRSDPKTQEHFPNRSDKTQICGPESL